MLASLGSYWLYGTTFCGVEITTDGDKDAVYAVTANKKKGEFKNLEYHEADSVDGISKHLSNHQHTFLIVNTSHVLIKEVMYSGNDQKALSLAFPGLSLSEFYYEVLPVKSKCSVAVCRKDYVDALLKEFSNHKINVIGFQLGVSTLPRLIPFLKEDTLHLSRHCIAVEDNTIAGISEAKETSNKTYKVDAIEVTSSHLLSVSALFNYISEVGSFSNFSSENRNAKALYGQKNFFRRGVTLAVGFLLISLLGNALLFNSYYKKQQGLQQEVTLLKSQKEAFTKKLEAIESKEQIIDNILNSGSSKSSYFINRIASGKPGSVRFSEIQFQPLKRSIRPDKKIEPAHDEIIVRGESLDNSDFSNWIESLESQPWAHHITVAEYGSSGTSTASFSITILIDEDDTEE